MIALHCTLVIICNKSAPDWLKKYVNSNSANHKKMLPTTNTFKNLSAA